ncbi:hypothetical protein QQ020_34765 [Fulvivirgaceae bacterium BMA12]|uniref:Uncharacterized protein n=1 Tax=Agaribacillus aureus TaxID=3051825 RepID=A0ABT8LHK9_9BACT|nr:hypothetical protein [Fulvivirgaceae bacterium BMA12]
MHPFKISVTKAVYNESDSTIIVNSKFFIDDFEVALQEFKGDKSFRLSEHANSDELRVLIASYLDSTLTLTTDKKINLKLFNVQFNELVVQCEQCASDVAPFNKIEVKNSMLIEVFEMQENLFTIRKLGFGEKSVRTNYEKTKDITYWW